MAGRPQSKLKRGRHVREPKVRFTVFCEGKNTEPAYLDSLNRYLSNATLLDIQTVPAAGVPSTIAEMAAALTKQQRRARRGRTRDSFEENDQVWAVFDRDEHHGFKSAVQKCEDNGVKVGRSDPCFELWLVLHEEDYDKPCTRQEIQSRLEDLRPEYSVSSGKMPNCSDLMSQIEAAEDRAERQLGRRSTEGMAYGNPSTTVFKLTRAITLAATRARRYQ